ncbi:MAG: shikimate dehydrogenase [Chloroflexota bacterium]|nr:MAG: shikimate dehydrogenase [Chloroflexota bacterium]
MNSNSHSVLLAGVIGDPVAHSRSPAMHNAAFAHLGIAARYERWHTPAAELPARVAALRGAEYLGANVTLPHKIAVIELLDRLSPLAEQIGAVNTIVREESGALAGYNTDAPAVVGTLRGAGFEPSGASVVILGASGAARAAVFALAEAGAAQITLVNRTLERAEQLAADVLAATDNEALRLHALQLDDPDLAEALAEAGLLVNATSLGWHGDETPLPADLIPPGALVFDMVYRQTRLLRDAAARGARTLDGLDMLVRQAGLAFELWTGREAPLDVMRDALGSAD